MAVVISALLPVSLLIVLGFILKRSLMRLDTHGTGWSYVPIVKNAKMFLAE